MKSGKEIATEIFNAIENNTIEESVANDMLKAYEESVISKETEEVTDLINSIIEEKKCCKESDDSDEDVLDDDSDEDDDDLDEEECKKESAAMKVRVEAALVNGLITENEHDIFLKYLS